MGVRAKREGAYLLCCFPLLHAAAAWCQAHVQRCLAHVKQGGTKRGAPRPCGIRSRGAYTPNAPLPLCTPQFLCICRGRVPRADGRERRGEDEGV